MEFCKVFAEFILIAPFAGPNIVKTQRNGYSASKRFTSGMKHRLRLILILAVVSVCATGTWMYFSQSRPIGAGPAGPAVPAVDFAKPWSKRPVLLVGLGDSVTAGFGARK